MAVRVSDSRFAVYLIPPYEIAQAVAEIHQMLRKQFGLSAADRFQVHVTIKGFFKKVKGPLEPLVGRLDAAFATQRPFAVHFGGLFTTSNFVGLDISRIGNEPNQEMTALRKRVVDAVYPFIAPDCDFVEEDLGNPFQPHITLAFRDIPASLLGDVLAYLRKAPLPTEPFIADTFHFLEFFSPDWDGSWWQSLSWRLLKTWRLEQ